MNTYSLPPLIGALFSIFMGFFIFLKNKKSDIHISFALFCLALFTWLFGYTIAYSMESEKTAIFFVRLACTGAMFTAPSFYYFTISYLRRKEEKRLVFASYITFILFTPFTMTSTYFLSGAYKYFWGYYSKAGLLYPLYLVIFFGIFIRGFLLLYASYKKRRETSSPLGANQVRYIFVGYIMAFLGSIDYIPKFGVEFYPFGFLFEIIFISIIAYAIVKYKVLDINVIFKKSLTYSLSASLLTGFFIILVLLMSRYLSGLAGINELRISIFSALIISFLFAPLKNRIQSLIDKLFYKTSYNYYDVIQKASRELSAKIYLKDIQKFIVELIADTLKIKDAHFLLAGGKYYVTVYHMKSKDKSSDESTYKRLRIRNDSELIRLLKDRRDIIIREELPGFIESDRAEAIAADMAPFSGEAAAPIISDGELEAIMILGGKQSGDIFTDEDINLLRTISNETALSMKTASLYAEKLRTERLATVGMTATTLAHEIKNPLSSIKTFSQLLPEKYADEEFRDTFAAIVPGEIQRIDNLVTELLTFTRNAPSSNMERIEITTLIEDSLKLFSDQFRKSNVKVIKDYSEPLYIKGERVRIKQALINILSNGCQAMENGGVLKIATVFDDKININIEDSGVGIHEKDIERVFEPFFTTKATGNGLGLTISKKIIEDHGGSISVSSRQNEGTAFTLSFEPADDVKEDYKGEQPLLWNS